MTDWREIALELARELSYYAGVAEVDALHISEEEKCRRAHDYAELVGAVILEQKENTRLTAPIANFRLTDAGMGHADMLLAERGIDPAESMTEQELYSILFYSGPTMQYFAGWTLPPHA